MDDIELALSAGQEIGRLYKSGKDFSEHAPALALSFLRGFAAVYCDVVSAGRTATGVTLAEKIRFLHQQDAITSPAHRNLRVLLLNGNKAAHPEHFEYIKLDFRELVTEALHAARKLVEDLHWLKNQVVPAYTIAPTQSGAPREMCVKAMLDQDLESMYLAGIYFLERAECEPITCFLEAGYPLTAKADIEQSMFWLKQAAERNHPGASYHYGYHLATNSFQEADRLKGERYIARAAEAEHTDALVYVGDASLHGTALFDKDEAYARKMFEDAARLGHPRAWAQLGAMESLGIGGETDTISALRYTIDAANAGIALAQFNLFVFYINSKIREERTIAIASLRDAAEQDLPIAVYSLAVYIQAGWVEGRCKSESEAEFIRALVFPEYRARSALSAAKMIEARSNELSDLTIAAKYLQMCYEITVTDDPHELKGECLSACRRVVQRMRNLANQHNPDGSPSLDDIFALTLFDKNCVPFADSNERTKQILSRIKTSNDPHSVRSNTEMLLREAGLDAKSKLRNLGDPRKSVNPRLLDIELDRPTSGLVRRSYRVGRNEFCPCGSGEKFKRCHGK
jgi:uncharacterized protein